jgi:hypothetical protein
MSADSVPRDLSDNAVGCFECHGLNPDAHTDTFDHFGFRIHIVVSPGDCKSCHPVEVAQYGAGKKAHALDNLQKNPLFHTLVTTALSLRSVQGGTLSAGSASNNAKNEACYACHGTRIETRGTRTLATDAGETVVPVLTNWPNQGVGRINPDGTMGSCTACHARHAFSIEMARKPQTCGQCHLEPDVPAYNVYKESKHGNIEESSSHAWNWSDVPWVTGKSFTAPSCATCHNSLVTRPDGTVLAERSHDFGARTWVRIFGLVTSHPQPASGATHTIRNADGLPLPVTFAGAPASGFLIGREEQQRRRAAMEKTCSGCHGQSWIDGHFAKFDSTLLESDRMVLASTQLLAKAWDRKLADRSNPFDESIEQHWVRHWLFYANSVRYGSAMSGPDYATFKNGWWEMTGALQRLHEAVNAPKKK